MPVAPHAHVSASGSLDTWIAAGRRPLVPRSAVRRRGGRRGCPACVRSRDDLRGRRWRSRGTTPRRTWLPPGVPGRERPTRRRSRASAADSAVDARRPGGAAAMTLRHGLRGRADTTTPARAWTGCSPRSSCRTTPLDRFEVVVADDGSRGRPGPGPRPVRGPRSRAGRRGLPGRGRPQPRRPRGPRRRCSASSTPTPCPSPGTSPPSSAASPTRAPTWSWAAGGTPTWRRPRPPQLRRWLVERVAARRTVLDGAGLAGRRLRADRRPALDADDDAYRFVISAVMSTTRRAVRGGRRLRRVVPRVRRRGLGAGPPRAGSPAPTSRTPATPSPGTTDPTSPAGRRMPTPCARATSRAWPWPGSSRERPRAAAVWCGRTRTSS